jgi:putative ABC transport system substrate-binding protein
MNRRDAMLGIALLGIPAARALAQQGKVYRVGVLRPGSAKEPAWVQREPFERGLRELGWKPGANVVIEYRYGEGDLARLVPLARELASKRVDVFVVAGVHAAEAAQKAGPQIPIVMAASNDPVAEGLAVNLARPGRNITGIAIHTFDMDGKRLELLKEAFPRVRRVALLANPTGEPKSYAERINELRAGARQLGVELDVIEVTRGEDIPGAFARIERGRFDALLVRPEPRVMDLARAEIVAFASRLKLPAVYSFRFYVDAGGLMSYGESIPGFHHRSASYVSRILNGANASELAFERPTKFEMAVNLKTAKAIGVEIPRAVLFRADHVIE